MEGIYAGISGGDIIELIVLIVLFALILFITYYVTKFIGNIQKTQMASGNIQIVEVRTILGNKQLAIVKVGEECFLIGIGKDEINLLGKVDGDSLNYNVESSSAMPFDAILEKVKNIREKKK